MNLVSNKGKVSEFIERENELHESKKKTKERY